MGHPAGRKEERRSYRTTKKKRGRYAQERMKVHVKARGKKAPTLKLTLFLPEEVVNKIFPQMKRFVKASKERRSTAKD
jgi:hypothetical protein